MDNGLYQLKIIEQILFHVHKKLKRLLWDTKEKRKSNQPTGVHVTGSIFLKNRYFSYIN